MGERENCILIYVVLGGAASVYAALLSTPNGRRFADDHTAETVIGGVSLVLAALRFLLPWPMFRLVALAFMVAGGPMIARSAIKRLKTAGLAI